MIENKVIVVNKLGIHARAAAKLVNTANAYTAQIELVFGSKRANAKSIMSVMMLAAAHGSEIHLYVSGDDESEAIVALTELFESGFNEGVHNPCP